MADKLISRGMERWKVRRLAMNVVIIGFVLGLFVLKYIIIVSVVLVCIVVMFGF